MNTKETRREIKGVRQFYVDRLCKCGGNMRPTGDFYSGDFYSKNPLQHVHRCDKCAKEEAYTKEYPYVDIEYVF